MSKEEQAVEETVEAPENSVEADEESVDMVALISEGDEEVKPVLDKRDKALIKFKQQGKAAKREVEELKQQLADLAKKVETREAPEPDPTKYDDGAEDPKYLTDLKTYIGNQATMSVEDVVAKRLKEERETHDRETYLERHESVIRDRQDKVNELIAVQIKDKPEVEAIIKSDSFMQTLSQVPIALTAKIAKSEDVGILFEYYAKNPQRFANLAANDPEEVINLGVKMGKIAQLKAKGKAPNVIKPLQGGDNTAKLDPVKDYDKYTLPDGSHDTHRWRKDMYGTT
jgi:phage I-like protein